MGLSEQRFGALLDALGAWALTNCDRLATEGLVTGLSEMVYHAKRKAGIDVCSETGGVVIAGVFADRGEAFRVGDSHLAIDGKAMVRRPHVERIGSEARRLVIEAALKRGMRPAAVMRTRWYKALFLPYLKAQLAFANDPDHVFGFPVINGQSVPIRFLETYPISLKNCEIVFATDGYLSPALNRADAEHELQLSLANDPMCIGTSLGPKGLGPGLASFDDRTYLRISI